MRYRINEMEENSDEEMNAYENHYNTADTADSVGDQEMLRVATRRQNGAFVLAAQGDVDLSTVEQLRTALSDSLAHQEAIQTLILDLTQVEFLDSAGLALLVELRNRIKSDGSLSLLVEKGSQPERVLKLGRFDQFIPMRYH
ncbi:MAG: hypothetical protein OHK0029_31930 [Armatimonadaceae bacterium]